MQSSIDNGGSITHSIERTPILESTDYERPTRFSGKTNRFSRLLLPQERADENPPEEKPKPRSKTYTKRPNDVIRELRFAQSVVDSLNSFDRTVLFDDLESAVYDDCYQPLAIASPKRDEDRSIEARSIIKSRKRPPKYLDVQPSSHIYPTNLDIWSIPVNDVEAVLSGELPLPYPTHNEKAFQSIQRQLDETVVSKLPSEFWGSQFYMDSSTILDLDESEHLPPSFENALTQLTSIANHKMPKLMQVVHKRFSRKRSTRYLHDLERSFAIVVDPRVLKKAMKRMKTIADSLYTISDDKKTKII